MGGLRAKKPSCQIVRREVTVAELDTDHLAPPLWSVRTSPCPGILERAFATLPTSVLTGPTSKSVSIVGGGPSAPLDRAMPVFAQVTGACSGRRYARPQ
jgi:hypothetical protein